jgi:hypothetical protein
MRRAKARTSIAAALALLALAVPARAEVATLLCSTNASYSEILDIDLANETVCELPSFAKPPCFRSQATITDRYIVFNGRDPITLDRRTGIIRWADGSTGACQRANKPLL